MPDRPLLLAASAALSLVALLPGCTGQAVPERGLPSLYLPLTTGSTALDTGTAREMISAYRRNNGAAALSLDPELQKLAETEAAAMAAADRPSSSRTVRSAIGRLGFAGADANLSAGYHTLAEAFSGWRDSPPHRAVMLSPEATRMGIATAYAPDSKYKVYWALLVAQSRRGPATAGLVAIADCADSLSSGCAHSLPASEACGESAA